MLLTPNLPITYLLTCYLCTYLLTYLLSSFEPTYHQPTYQSIFGPYFDTMLPFLLPITHLPTNLLLFLFLYNVVTCATWIYKGLCPPTPSISPLGTIYRNFISLVWILWFTLGDTLKFFCIKPLVIDVNDQRWARGAYVVVIFHL